MDLISRISDTEKQYIEEYINDWSEATMDAPLDHILRFWNKHKSEY